MDWYAEDAWAPSAGEPDGEEREGVRRWVEAAGEGEELGSPGRFEARDVGAAAEDASEGRHGVAGSDVLGEGRAPPGMTACAGGDEPMPHVPCSAAAAPAA